MKSASSIWLVSGVRTPFAKMDGALRQWDAIALSAPVLQAMARRLPSPYKPDLVVWGTVAPNLGWSNIAREVALDAGLDPSIPAFSTIMACSTSMVAVLQAAQMLNHGMLHLALAGGVESMSRVQIGLNANLSFGLRRALQSRGLAERLRSLRELNARDLRLHIPSVTNRITKKSMGEHAEEMAQHWRIARAPQDEIALVSHQRVVAAQHRGFFDDLIVPIGNVSRDTLPRADSSLEKLARLPPVFDTHGGRGTITAASSSPLTDGAAACWVATDTGLERLPLASPRACLVDWEMAAVDIRNEGLLMAPAYAIPRLLYRQRLRYEDIDLWEIHEAFAAQVLCNIAALNDKTFVRRNAGIDQDLGTFPVERMNPNGGSIALGHPFGATGARILSQAVKTLAGLGAGKRAVVSICADGGLGTVALLQT
ncbi:MAG TPA: acetyl-CoA C-acyltransferase [Burkholderiales bacterium]|nr:acetyl-CoA C-acyltransferase [Burkholderiales bacterium]